jgi:hypothetical protein
MDLGVRHQLEQQPWKVSRVIIRVDNQYSLMLEELVDYINEHEEVKSHIS